MPNLLRKVATMPTALWVDSIAHVPLVGETLDAIAATKNPDARPVFVLYDLPNRDCSARSSAGELSVEHGGVGRYKAEVVDRIAGQLRAHPKQHAAFIIEPDSLANLATNLGVAKCAASEQAYRESIAYALKTLSAANATLYLDAGHAGWLGWDENRRKIANVFADVLALAGDARAIRGFAVNVSGYDPVDGEEPKGDGNPCSNETKYVAKLSETLATVGIHNKGFIVDTSRNGVAGARTKPGNWCNVKGAGLGPRPRADAGPLVDAYLWVKPPGDSDGTSDPASARYDANCSSADAMPNAPEAGAWFAAYLALLAQHANPPL